MSNIIQPLIFWHKNPAMKPQLDTIKEQNPGMSIDISDRAQAMLVPFCKVCRSGDSLALSITPVEENLRYQYGCFNCHCWGVDAEDRPHAVMNWANHISPEALDENSTK